MMAPFVFASGGQLAFVFGSTQPYPAVLIDPLVSEHTSFAPGTKYASACTPRPTHTRRNFGPTTAHLPSLHLPLSHSSSESQSSPSAFLPVHLPPEHVPLVHSLSDSHSSPPAFFSTHLPSPHVPLLHSSFFSQSSPASLVPLLHPGKPGGHSGPVDVSAHCFGGSPPGRLGGGPAMSERTGTVNGLFRLPEVATGSFWSLKPSM